MKKAIKLMQTLSLDKLFKNRFMTGIFAYKLNVTNEKLEASPSKCTIQ